MTQAEVLEQRTCPECGLVIEGPPSGKRSVNWLYQTHLYGKHKIKSTNPRRGKKAGPMPTIVDLGPERSAVSLLKGSVEAVGGGKNAPSANQLNSGLAHLLTMTTMGFATYLAESDPTLVGPQNDELRDTLIDELTLPEKDAALLTRPLARIAAPTRLNKRFGRAVVDNVDVVDTVYVAMDIVIRYRNYMRRRSQYGATVHQLYPVPTAQPQEGPLPPVDVTSPVDEQGATPPGQAPRVGRVIGYEEAQQMIAEQGGRRG